MVCVLDGCQYPVLMTVYNRGTDPGNDYNS